MCGIAGFWGRFDGSMLESMAKAIAHRGPDDAGYFQDAGAGLGLAHRRLSIIDLSPLGQQPMSDVAGRAYIVFNGEIYNYRELRAQLVKAGAKFRSHTDTEVLLQLYLTEGLSFLGRLNGIFAFAIWDVEKQTLLLARDGVGVKPLYFAQTETGCAFASEVKALLCVPGLDRTVDATALRRYLTYLYSPSPQTALRGVKKIEPGEALLMRDGVITRRWRHYSLPVGPTEPMTERDAVEQLRSRLAEAVRRQMVADVPVGAFLSGGLDSSAIVHFARSQVERGALACYTIDSDSGCATGEGFPDDLPYAERVAQHLGVPLHRIKVGPELADQLDFMVQQLDEPQADFAALNVFAICRAAREHGIKVLLSGAGGDDLFSGYRRHQAQHLERWWSWLPVGGRALLRRGSASLPQQTALGRRVARVFANADCAPPQRLVGYFQWLQTAEVTRLFHPDVRIQMQGDNPDEPMLAALRALPSGIAPLDRMLHLEQRFFLPDHNLNYTDKLSMAAGLEVRVPFLDPDLMTFASKVPPALKQRGTESKWLFKRAMEENLPHDVIYRPKAGFGVPLRQWLRRELKDYVAEMLSDESLRRRGIFDPAAVQRLLQMNARGVIDASYPILGLMCIEIWCRRFVDVPVTV